jgi:hypothetical protein
MEPRRKLRSIEDWQAPSADLLEAYLSDSSVEADGENDQEVREASASKPPRHMKCCKDLTIKGGCDEDRQARGQQQEKKKQELHPSTREAI